MFSVAQSREFYLGYNFGAYMKRRRVAKYTDMVAGNASVASGVLDTVMRQQLVQVVDFWL